MAKSSSIKSLGWGNQPRVELHAGGAFAAPGVAAPVDPSSLQALHDAGDGLYRMASIVDDQTRNPFQEAGVGQDRLNEALNWISAVLARVPPVATLSDGLDPAQALQLRASAGVVVLSIAESQAGRKSRDGLALVKRAMQAYFSRLETEPDPLVAERMVMNLDWVIPSLPNDLATRARGIMQKRLPWAPPYDAWFANGNTTLRIDWKCGSEFLEGWKRRLQEEKFTLVSEGGFYGDTELRKVYEVNGKRTEVLMNIGGEKGNVFRKMDDPSIHVVGYDGHSDWGRKIPRSLYNAPKQVGPKAVLYLLCSGKQILQKVRETYPIAEIVTTFNSSRFTLDFKYSEDFSAFIHILEGFARRESWEQIRNRVNKDWYNNPEKNYLFPNEALAMARSLDRDHDGQTDMFDKLIDFSTFDVRTDTMTEFTPRVPETPQYKIVGTKLHFAVQVFHTLAHFNQILERFTHDLRVYADGWYDPTLPAAEGVIERGPTRIRVVKGEKGPLYYFQASSHYAHASEEAWRALAAITLCDVVMSREQEFQRTPPEERVMNGLMLVGQSLEVDDMLGRDEAIWNRLLPALKLPTDLSLSVIQQAKKVDTHWYAGSRASITQLKKTLPQVTIDTLRAWSVHGGKSGEVA